MNERIEIDPRVCHGKPVIRGTRVPVSIVLGAIAGGDPMPQIADDYGVTEDDVRACVAFARDELERLTFHPLPV